MSDPTLFESAIDPEATPPRRHHRAPMADEPCRCWNFVALHAGHCCFDDPTPLADIKPGDLPPCGHWVGPRPGDAA